MGAQLRDNGFAKADESRNTPPNTTTTKETQQKNNKQKT